MSEQVGLSAVFNLNDFSVNIQNYLSQVNLIESATGAAVARLNQLGNSLQNSANQVHGLGNAFQQGLGIGFGIQAINMFTGLAAAIGNAGSEALNTVAFFERLQFSVQAIEADTLKSANGTLSFSEALQQAQKPAQNILRYLDKISLLSPFTPEQVDRAFQTATAYGLTANEALRLTQAFTDFAAARGISGEKLQNISLAISQISAKGKLMAQEMNQLAESGVPIRKILGEALHLTQQQLSDIMEKGAIPASDAIGAIVNNFEKYAGSAKRATFTFSGLLSTLGEIKQLGERDLFGAIFRPALPLLQKFVEFASSDQFSAILTVLGEKIGNEVAAGIQNLTNTVQGFITTWAGLPPAVKEGVVVFGLTAIAVTGLITVIGGLELAVGALVTPFGLVIGTVAAFAALWVENFSGIQQVTSNVFTFISDGLSTLASEAVTWGTNIIESIATGIEGAVSVIIDALNVVGQAITSLLQPGSPPKLLPELDTWGKKAGEVYLQGWTTADFSFLDTFGNMISTQLHNLVGLGKVDQEDLPQMIFGGRQAFAEALNQIVTLGTVSEDAVAKIAKTTGLAGNTVRAFLVDYGDLKVATDKLNVAQNALNATLKGYDDKLTPLKKHLQDIEDAQQNAQDAKTIIQLKRVINNANVSAARRQAALAQLDQIQTKQQITLLERQRDSAEEVGKAKVDSAQAALDQAKQNLDLLKAQTDETLNLQSILAQTGLLQKNLADTAKERAKKFDAELDPLKKQLKVMQLQQDALKDHVREAQLKAILEDKHATAAQKTAAQLELQEIAVRKQIREVEASRLRKEGFAIDLTSIEKIPVVLADIAKKGKAAKPVLDSVFGAFKGLSDAKIGEAMTEFGKSVDDVRKKFNTFGLKVDEIKDKIDNAMPSFLKIKEGADGSVPAVHTLTQAFEGFALFFGTTKLISILQNLGPLLLNLGTKTNIIAAAVALLATAWFNNWFGIQERTAVAIDAIKKKFDELTGGKGLSGIQEKIRKFFETIIGYFNDPTTLGGQAKAKTEAGLSFVEQWVADHFNQKSIDAALATVSSLLQPFFVTVQGYFSDPKTLGGQAKEQAQKAVGYLQKWVADHFNQKSVDDALLTIQGLLQTFFASVQAYFNDPATLGGSAKQAVTSGATQTLGYIQKWVNDNFNETTFNNALTTIQNKLRDFFTTVQGYFSDPGSLLGKAKEVAANVLGFVQKWVADHFNATTFSTALTTIQSKLRDFFTTVRDYFSDPSALLGKAKEAAKNAFDYLTQFVEDFFSKEHIAQVLGDLAKTIQDFKDQVHNLLYGTAPGKANAGPASGGGGGGFGGGKSSSLLTQFIEDNFGEGPFAVALKVLQDLWKNNVTIIVDDLINPLKEAFTKSKDQETGLGTNIGDFIIRATGIGIGAFLKWTFGVAIPNMVLGLLAIGYGLYSFFAFTLPTLAGQGIDGAKKFFTDHRDALKDGIAAIGQGVKEGFDLMAQTLHFELITQKVQEMIRDVKAKFFSFQQYFTVQLPIDLATVGDSVIGAIKTSFTNAVTNASEGLAKIGSDISSGLAGGVLDFFKSTDKTLDDAWQLIVDSVKKFFGIESPSTLMHDGPGADIGGGLVGGIKDYITKADNLKELLKGFTDLVGSIFSVENIKKFTDAAFTLGGSIFTAIGDGFKDLAKTGADFISSLFGGGGEDTSKASQAGAGQAETANKKLEQTMAGIAKGLDSDTVVTKLNAIVLGFLQMQELCQGQVDMLLEGVKATFTQMQTDLLAIEQTIQTDAYTEFHLMNTQTNLEVELMHTGINTEMGLLQIDMEAAMKKLYDAVISKAKQIRDDVVTVFDQMKTRVIEKINAMKDDFVAAFKALFTAALGALDQFITDFMNKLSAKGGLIDQVKTLFTTEGKNAGTIFADAIEKAILDKVKDIVDAAKKAAQDAKEAVDNTLNGNDGGGGNNNPPPPGTPFSRANVLAAALNKSDLAKTIQLNQVPVNTAQTLASRLGPTSSPVMGNNNVVRNYNLTLNTSQQSKGVVTDFWIMQTMGV